MYCDCVDYTLTSVKRRLSYKTEIYDVSYLNIET